MEPRAHCLRCRRPTRVCFCAQVPCLPTRTRVVFFQHPRERRVAVGTARMAHLALPNSELHVGLQSSFVPKGRTALLFPGPAATDVRELGEGDLDTLVVVDGTWKLAKKLLSLNPALKGLPRITLRPERPGNYRIRREPAEECLATVEAVALALGHLEGDPERFSGMLRPFEAMVDRQLEFARTRTGPSRYRRPVLRRPRTLEEFVGQKQRAIVLAYAEGNAHPHGKKLAIPAELVHLVALRPATGERFEAVLRPRRSLGPRTCEHVELEEEMLLGGEPVEATLGRWRNFLGEGAWVATWGCFTPKLLAQEGALLETCLDLRLWTARTLRKRFGGLEEAAAVLGLGTPGRIGPGRAGRRLFALAKVFEALLFSGKEERRRHEESTQSLLGSGPVPELGARVRAHVPGQHHLP